MFINLSHLRNSVCRLRVYQSGRSCVRWLCITPFSSLDVKNTAFHLTLRAGIAVAQEGVMDSRGMEPQRHLTKPAVRRYDVIELALLKYKEMHGDMLVPAKFIIPNDDESWPEETWGMKLGKTVRDIRSGATYQDKWGELASIGFDYSPRRVRFGYGVVESALLQYKVEYGNMIVPYAFIIPSDDESWPEKTRGMKLGHIVNNIRSGHSYKDKRKELASIGFDYNPQSTAHGYDVVELALLKYKEIHGDMLVPYAFIISRDDESWPEKTRGMKLGHTVKNIRSGAAYEDKREELLSIGFDYSSQSIAHGYQVVKSALLRYKEMHGDMLVVGAFIIPNDDESWPEETWGMKLGQTVNQIRSGATYKDKQEELASIGFDYNPQSTAHGYDVVELALLKYKEMHGDMLVSQSFIIPCDDESWPEVTWGMKLGHTVNSIRSCDCYLDKREELLSIGFDYSPQRPSYGYDVVKSALLRYKEIHGDMLVVRSFVIPSDDESWPEETWGMKLGHTVKNIRRGRSYKDRQEELITIDSRLRLYLPKYSLRQ